MLVTMWTGASTVERRVSRIARVMVKRGGRNEPEYREANEFSS